MAQPAVSIFFGSQSGTAECFSEELRDEAEQQGITAKVVDLQDFTPASFSACKIAVLVVSTYGDGEPTDNAVQFHKWASNPKNSGALDGQRFCVMGLGDMNYSRFNNMGYLTDLHLERLGAKRIYKRGIGDDSQDIASDFKSWKEDGLWDSLKAAVAEVQKEAPRVETVTEDQCTGTPLLKIGASKADLPAEVPGAPGDVLARFYFEAETAKVLRVQELRQMPSAREGLATAWVEMEAKGSLSSYTLGGTLSLLPECDPADVAAMLPLLGLKEPDLAKFVTFVPAEGGTAKIKCPFPTPCTLGQALSRYCDLGRVPSKKFLAALQAKVADEALRQRLERLLADADFLKHLAAEPACCRMPEFLSMIGVKSLDLGDFLLHCPRQRPREFTIASSPKAAPQRISLCISLTSHEVPDLSTIAQRLKDLGCLASTEQLQRQNRFLGMCSSWMTMRLQSGNSVLAKQRPSPLTLPEKDVPIIMVGAGAGVAPFRGFWEELRRGPQSAPAALFFGCRHPDQDWLFKEEMSSAVKLNSAGCAALARVQAGPKRPLACLFTAFSRPGEGKQGSYVQDQVLAQSTAVKHWMEKMGGVVFICGSTAMGNGVLKALADVLEGGKETVDSLRKEGRIVAELWG